MPHVAAGIVLRALDYDHRRRMGTPTIRARPVQAHREGRARRALELVATSTLAVDAAVLGSLTIAAAAAFLWTKAPLYNQLGTIDPWLYTALWTNFDQVYSAFSGTYYISRVPWIVPGYVLNGVFDARAAFLILHTAFFLGGGVLLYALCRRWLGVLAAATAYVALIGSQMYFNAHRWDYQEGGVITFMIAAYAFSLPRNQSVWVRAASMGLGGFFAAAMATTRVLDVVYLVGLPLLYFAVVGEIRREGRREQLARDLVAFAAGALTLVVAGGLFARANGEEFFFFMPQVRVVRSTSGGFNQLPVDQWLPFAPYVWVPVFVVIFGAVVFAVGPRGDVVARRVLAASMLWLVLDFVPFALWQFLGSGWLFNVSYYFSSFLVPTLICLASAVAVLLGVRAGPRRWVPVGAACAVAVLAPLAWIYRSDSPLKIAGGYRDDTYVATAALMVTAIVLVALVCLPRLRAIAAAAVTAAFLATAYGVDGSSPTLAFGASDRRTGEVYDVGQQLIDFLRVNGYSERLPLFWYDVTEEGGAIGSIQSLYYYGYTYVANAMPKIDGEFRSRFSAFQVTELVLLCRESDCNGGPAALERAGYRPRVRLHVLLGSGDFLLWVRSYEVSAPPAG